MVALVGLAVVFAAGCGTTNSGTPKSSESQSGAGQTRTDAGAGGPAAFAWLRPAPAPAAWPVAHVPGAIALAYPRTWSRIQSDRGTVSAARVDARSGLIAEYLNATPQQAQETPANWTSFRPAHNREEGDSHVRVLATARNLRFRNGLGSCVIDRYTTSRTTYQEIACLVRGHAGGPVIVAAAQAAGWAQAAPALERAVSAFEA